MWLTFIFVLMKPISINSIAELPKVAEELLSFANGDKFFVFEGEMAAGKTTFIKSLSEALGVEDVAATCEKIKQAGGNVTREAGPVKGGSTIIAFVTDPDGYKVELIQRLTA